MSDSGSSRLEIVKGSRKRKKTARIITYSVVAAVVLVLIIVNILTPTGIVETLQNSYAITGEGNFPTNIYSQNAYEVKTYKDVQFLVNDSYFEVYNGNGVLVQAASHGMSNPRLEVSAARALLFDRDRYTAKIYNYSSELSVLTFKENIFSAAIGRNGTYAVATGSDSYLGTVYVYNKNDKLIYTWNSASYYIADVAVSDNGKSIAVCLIGASGGSFVSAVYILEFDSATPIEKYEFNSLITSLSSVGKNYLLASGTNRAYSIPWKGGVYTDLGVTGVVRNYVTDFASKYSVIAFGRENNEGSNTVTIVSNEGKIVTSFAFSAPITDINIGEDYVVVLSDNSIYIYDLAGALIEKVFTETKSLFVSLTTDNDIITYDNSLMRKISLGK